MWHETTSRKSLELWIDRGLCAYWALLILVNLINLYQIYDIASWEEVQALVGVSTLLVFVIPALWKGLRIAQRFTMWFYGVQILSTLVIGVFYWHIDFGFRLALGYLHSGLQFQFLFFNTTISAGFLNADQDGTAYGFMVNLFALAMTFYYRHRLGRAD